MLKANKQLKSLKLQLLIDEKAKKGNQQVLPDLEDEKLEEVTLTLQELKMEQGANLREMP